MVICAQMPSSTVQAKVAAKSARIHRQKRAGVFSNSVGFPGHNFESMILMWNNETIRHKFLQNRVNVFRVQFVSVNLFPMFLSNNHINRLHIFNHKYIIFCWFYSCIFGIIQLIPLTKIPWLDLLQMEPAKQFDSFGHPVGSVYLSSHFQVPQLSVDFH